jgi:hypothetical protein
VKLKAGAKANSNREEKFVHNNMIQLEWTRKMHTATHQYDDPSSNRHSTDTPQEKLFLSALQENEVAKTSTKEDSNVNFLKFFFQEDQRQQRIHSS